jgi:hypothetical protein
MKMQVEPWWIDFHVEAKRNFLMNQVLILDLKIQQNLLHKYLQTYRQLCFLNSCQKERKWFERNYGDKWNIRFMPNIHFLYYGFR